MAAGLAEPDRYVGVSFSDDIVITGISGHFPGSNPIKEFKQQLFDGFDLVTYDTKRCPSGLYGLPTRTGKIKNLQYFDANFFGVHAKQAHVMDPQLRMLLELTYEALVDAGVNPAEVRGSKTGVFVDMSDTDSSEFWKQDSDQVNKYELSGCRRAMFPSRISNTFDFTGPSYVIDTSCSSSLFAFQQAVTAIKTEQCDSAIVGGVNLLLKPTSSSQFHRLSMQSPQGMCEVFDASGNGYVRSGAAVVLYLQKLSVSRRVYATVLGARTNIDSSSKQGITFLSCSMQKKYIQEMYDEIDIKPQDVSYIEHHGTGNKVEDQQEVNSIADLFCKNRKDPLLIGSVKSNIGNSGPASGLCFLAKIVVTMEAGMIPQNPNSGIAALNEGHLKVVAKNESWNGGIVAINSFGFGGANAHIILKSNPKLKTMCPAEPIPRVVGVSGTTQEVVEHFLAKIQQNRHDKEFLALIDEVHARRIKGHTYRGYAILKDQAIEEVTQVAGCERPIVFIFSGTGSQWPGMAKDLMQLECFKNSIKKCSNALRPRGIDLENVIVHGTQATFENILNSFISITAMQIALTDVLKILGVEPDLIVGQSVGELACAYADGAFTLEQTVLSAYCRGRAVLDSNLPPGAMAAVGLTWEGTKKLCPPEIIPASHNSEDCIGVSGPPAGIDKFVEELQAQGIFAKRVDTSNMAFHSKYVADAGPRLQKFMDEIIPDPKPRSAKWISSSIPETEWGTPLSRKSSAAYHVNNMLSPILFHQAMQHVPENAIVIEIAPSGLMQTILKRSLRPEVTNICLIEREHYDNVEFILSALGKIYNAGAQPKLSKLYHPISFPVARGTPMISSLIEWDHSVEWFVPSLAECYSRPRGASVIEHSRKNSDK